MHHPKTLDLPPGWTSLKMADRTLMAADAKNDPTLGFALSIAHGLDARPRRLDSTYLYDDEGCRIFAEITRQPEYYQTRVEDAILARHARDLRAMVGSTSLIELGSGNSTKTERLLDAWTEREPTFYAPVDVSQTSLTEAIHRLANRYRDRLTVHALAGAYDRALPLVYQLSPAVLAFLGSSIGNLGQHDQHEFLTLISDNLRGGDHLLLGLDQAHAPDILEAAYNDVAGWSARFTRNLFARMNRELGTDIPLDIIHHVAFYDRERQRVEIFAEFAQETIIELPAIGRSFRIARGERVQTEVSQKYGAEMIAEVERHGFSLAWQSLDEHERFGLFLFRRRAPLSRRAKPLALRFAALERIRQRTLALVDPLAPDDLEQQHSRLMSPIVWDLGHVANFEQIWLQRNVIASLRDAGVNTTEGLDPIYDANRVPRARRSELPLPGSAQVLAELGEVRVSSRRLWETLTPEQLGRSRLIEDGYALALVAQHEAQHQETILQSLNLRTDLPYAPAFIDPSPPATRPPHGERVLVPGGPFLMGTNDESAAYDNERPAHLVDVGSFWIDIAPVTNDDFTQFIEDGGYRRPEFWSPEGWGWLMEEAVQAPLGWVRTDEGWWRRAFSSLVPLDRRRPVVHVSWYEADAYARWAGKRLPTEAEWEKAAAWDPARGTPRRYPWGDAPAADNANLDQRWLEPLPVGTFPAGRSAFGCHQMLGDVWEWTASWFKPYPGFKAFPYREYSEPFFGTTHRVLRGGSFATSREVARNTFRNWDLPQRRQIFAGFRLAKDA
ncbi:MAG: ergothioneine biosynthesis protein EgtB [Deltaproteobacteria bacterium]|nr:ergothioneine biosynthesis protein EgtB [Deltaproteobacteria bacterium]